jgi:hypothetical protein
MGEAPGEGERVDTVNTVDTVNKVERGGVIGVYEKWGGDVSKLRISNHQYLT